MKKLKGYYGVVKEVEGNTIIFKGGAHHFTLVPKDNIEVGDTLAVDSHGSWYKKIT